MKKAASIMAVMAVMALAACNRGEPASAPVEAPAEAWVRTSSSICPIRS